MKAFLQKQGGEFANINTLTAFLGFREKGYEIQFFEFSELNTLDISPETPVSSGIPVILAALARLGVTPPELPSVPPMLESFAERRIWHTTMNEARLAVSEGNRIFVKPVPADRKLFSGAVFSEFKDTIATAHVPADYPVICSEVVDFVSEYRVFVMEREILGIKHYKGDFRVFPEVATIDAAVRTYESAPSAYGIDFGVTTDGRTLLVETNEAYSLGCYGLTPILYSSLLECRWLELSRPKLSP